nr:amidohydrolase family protein [Nitrososphaerota archaeon]
NPDRFIGFCRFLYHSPPESAAEQIERGIKDMGLKGVGEWALADMYPIPPHDIHRAREFTIPMDMIAKLKVPVLFHAGWEPLPLPLRYSDPLIIEDIADFYPDVPIIIGHTGKLDNYFREPALFVARKHDNVYLDLSFQTAPNIKQAIDNAGADHCLFSTYWEIPNLVDVSKLYETQLGAVESCKLNDTEYELIMGKNLSRLLKL